MAAIKRSKFHILVLCLLVFLIAGNRLLAGEGDATVIELTDRDKARLFYYALEDAINNPIAENLANLYTNIDQTEKSAIDEKVGYFCNSRRNFEEKSGYSIQERLLIKPSIGGIKENTLYSTAEITYQTNNYLSSRSFPLEFTKTGNVLKWIGVTQMLDSINGYIDLERSSIFNKEIPEPDTTFIWLDYDTLHIVPNHQSDNMLRQINFCVVDLPWPFGHEVIDRLTTTKSKDYFDENIIFGVPANSLALHLYDASIDIANHEFLMITDPAWNRIIAADRLKKWLYPFGSFGTGTYEFKQPQSMAFVYNYFVVADAYNYRTLVYKFYNDGSNDYVQSIQNNNGCIKDVAAAWYEDLSKHVAILDFDNARVDLCSLVTSLGNFHFEPNYSLFGCESGYGCLNKPTSICYDRFFNQQKDGTAIYITDAGNKRVLHKYLISDSIHTLKYLFPENSFLTSVDVDYFGNSYVVDKYNCKIYKFDRQRDLLAVYGSKGDGVHQLLYPLSINVGKTWKSDNTGMYYMPTGDIFINEYFAENTGIRRFLPGVDVLWTAQYTQTWPNLSQYCRLWVFWHQTETANCHKKLFRNDTLVIDYGTELVLADDIIYDYVDLMIDTIANGLFTYEINVKSYFNTNDTTLRFNQYIAHPEQPQNVEIKDCGYQQGPMAIISWDAVDPTGANYYDIYRNGEYLASTHVPRSYYQDSTAIAGESYSYKVRARWDNDFFSSISDSSLPFLLTEYMPAPPSNVSASLGSTTCNWTITWQDNSDNETGFYINIVYFIESQFLGQDHIWVDSNVTSIIHLNKYEEAEGIGNIDIYVYSFRPYNCAYSCGTYVHVCDCDTMFCDVQLNGHCSATIGICENVHCPFLYVWAANQYVEENNLLGISGSSEKKSEDYTEYHKVSVTPEIKDGQYSFQIIENGNDISYFDQIELFAVDKTVTDDIVIDNASNVYATTQRLLPAQAVDHNGMDITRFVNSKDMNSYYSPEPGYIDAIYIIDQDSKSETSRPDTGGTVTDPPIKGEVPNNVKVSASGFVEFVPSRLDIYVEQEGQWMLIDSSFGLAKQTEQIFAPALDLRFTSDTIKVRYQWNYLYRADEMAYLYTKVYPDPPIRIPLLSAISSQNGGIADQILISDNIRAQHNPNDTITLSFDNPSNLSGLDYKFVLKVEGFYNINKADYSITNAKPTDSILLPISFAFGQNYPNPFNPATTFKFALPQAEHVNLNIYNILGRKVESLIDENYEAGYHSISWSNNDLGSGVYFAKFQAGDFKSTRKVVIVK